MVKKPNEQKPPSRPLTEEKRIDRKRGDYDKDPSPSWGSKEPPITDRPLGNPPVQEGNDEK